MYTHNTHMCCGNPFSRHIMISLVSKSPYLSKHVAVDFPVCSILSSISEGL